MIIAYLRQRDWGLIAFLVVVLFVLSQGWAQLALELPPNSQQIMLKSVKLFTAVVITAICAIKVWQCAKQLVVGE